MTSARTKASGYAGTIVSINSREAHLVIFKAMKKTSAECNRLRDHVFEQIARSRKLQDHILKILAKHPATGRAVVVELAKDTRSRYKLLKIIGQEAYPIRH